MLFLAARASHVKQSSRMSVAFPKRNASRTTDKSVRRDLLTVAPGFGYDSASHSHRALHGVCASLRQNGSQPLFRRRSAGAWRNVKVEGDPVLRYG